MTEPALSRPQGKHFDSIDGLRGYLAFGVFLHHALIWQNYLQDGQWRLPDSRLFIHLGQSSVSLFFMITALLFFNKLLDGRERRIDWLALYVSRVARLLPVYLVAMVGLFVSVGCMTAWTLQVPLWSLVKQLGHWLAFTAVYEPDINGLTSTWRIVAGVTWSLPFEWLFYFGLPLMGLLLGLRPPLAALGIGVAALAWLFTWHPNPQLLLPFASGIAAAGLARSARWRALASTPWASLLALLSLCALPWVADTAFCWPAWSLLTVFFALVAGGNTLFGLLHHPLSRQLGELTYGIYLLHGLVLHTAFQLVIGPAVARGLSPLAYWGVVAALTPLLLALCWLVFRFIERPAMRSARPLLERWRRRGA